MVIADAPLDVLPIHAHAGAIIPKYHGDGMTIGPPGQSGNAGFDSSFYSFRASAAHIMSPYLPPLSVSRLQLDDNWE